MMSIKPLKSAKSACDYYTKAFNYYQGDATATAWLGRAKEHLSLPEEVDKTTMLQLLEGHMPDGSRLQNNRGEHRPGFDITFSAPKSVSLLVGLGASPELERFHDEAVKYALSAIEKEFAEVRFVKEGEIGFEKTDNLLFATFRQPTSRANDPDLHTHCVAMNLTLYHGKAKSLATDSKRIHGVVEQVQNNAHFIGLLYRHHLSNQLKEAGFQLRATGEGLFEIAGIPESVLAHFSTRRTQIKTLMEERGWEGAKSASCATLLTRNQKEEYDLSHLKQGWQQQALAQGFDAFSFVQNKHQILVPLSHYAKIKARVKDLFLGLSKEPEVSQLAKTCVDVAVETLSQRTAVFTERALKAECMRHSLLLDKAMDEAALTQAIVEAKKSQDLYASFSKEDNQMMFTTPWLLTLETETLSRIEINKNSVPAIATRTEIKRLQAHIKTSGYTLTESQKSGMHLILTTKDRFVAIQGYAGVAKTSMLRETKNLIEEKGYTLRGMAVASSAAHELQTKAGIRSDVFPVIYQELKRASRNSLSKTIFIVDEASMLSSPQGHELLKQIEYTNARLILVGDKAQLPSVNSGRLFELTQDYGIETAIMNDIVRQKNQFMHQAVVEATKGHVEQAIAHLTHVEEQSSYQARIEWIANAWLSKTPGVREETLLFAPTHANREDINRLLRQGLKQEGTLTGECWTKNTLKAKPIEAIQQRLVYYYQKNDVIRFNQDMNQGRLKKGLYYTVDTITRKHRQDNTLPLRDEHGKQHVFALKQLPAYHTTTAALNRVMEVYQSSNIELQAGERILFSRNFKSEHISNGHTATVVSIQKDDLILKFSEDDIRTILKNSSALKHIMYGYVLTNYKVQGRDANHAIGLMDSHHRFSATMKNFYVQISRAIQSMTLVTDDKTQLIAAIKRNQDEKLAVLDKFSSQQLSAHEARFRSQSRLSIQSVIEKKAEFEHRQQEQMNTRHHTELER